MIGGAAEVDGGESFDYSRRTGVPTGFVEGFARSFVLAPVLVFSTGCNELLNIGPPRDAPLDTRADLGDDACASGLPNGEVIDLSEADGFVSRNFHSVYEEFSECRSMDLDQLTVTFIPDESGTAYVVSSGPLHWDPDLGSPIVPTEGADPSDCDDCYAEVPIEFSFPFYGTERRRVFVGVNGYITLFARESQYTTVNFLWGLPRIAALFSDLVTTGSSDANVELGGSIFVSSRIEKLVVTFRNLQHYSHPGSSNTFQIVLSSQGLIELSYDGIDDVTTDSIAGIHSG